MSPLVLGHRGASGYRPENTLAAIALAIEQGADGVEIDVVPTRDGELVVRHDASLAATTDVAAHPRLADRRRDGDWWTTDLDAAEVAVLRARERWPGMRPWSAAHDDEQHVPTLAEVLALTAGTGALLVVEIKQPAEFARLGLDPGPLLVAALSAAPALPRLVLECFEQPPLDALAGSGVPRVLLREAHEVAGLDAAALRRGGFAGVSVPVDAVEPALIAGLHGEGLDVWAWTLRREARFLPAGATWREHFARTLRSGLDAVFADQPDLALAVRLSGAGAP